MISCLSCRNTSTGLNLGQCFSVRASSNCARHEWEGATAVMLTTRGHGCCTSQVHMQWTIFGSPPQPLLSSKPSVCSRNGAHSGIADKRWNRKLHPGNSN
eukprot:1357211-Amphidinium_carterae.1